MPVVKVKENEPFDVALVKKQVFCLKFVVANIMKNQQQNVSAKKLQQLSVMPRNWLAKTRVALVCTKIHE